MQKTINNTFSRWENSENSHPQRYVMPASLPQTHYKFPHPQDGAEMAYVFDLGESAVTDTAQLYNQWNNEGIANILFNKLNHALLPITGNPNNTNVFLWSVGGRHLLYIGTKIHAENQEKTLNTLAETLRDFRDHGVNEKSLHSILWNQITAKKYVNDYFDNLTNQQRADIYVQNINQSYPALSADTLASLKQSWSRTLSKSALNKHIHHVFSKEPTLYRFFLEEDNLKAVKKQLEFATTLFLSEGSKRIANKKQNRIQPISKSGTILKNTEHKNHLHQWTLSNGIQVWYQQNPYSNEQVRLVIGNEGGKSILPPEWIPASQLLPDSIFLSGIAGLTSQEANQYLQEKNTQIWPEILPTRHSIHFNTNRHNLNTALTFAHYLIQDVVFKEEALTLAKNKAKKELAEYALTNNKRFDDKIHQLRKNANAFRASTIEEIDAVNIQHLTNAHHALFNQSTPPIVTIVGNISPDRLKRLLEKYLAGAELAKKPQQIGSLPQATWAQDLPSIIGVNDEEQKSLVALYVLSNSMTEDSAKSAFIDDMLNRIINRRVMEQVREDQSLAYAPSTHSFMWDNEGESGWVLSAIVAPSTEKNTLQQFEAITQQLSAGVKEEEVTFAGKQLRDALINLDKNINSQANMFSRYLSNGWDINTLKDVAATIENISTEEVSLRAKNIFSKNANLIKAYNSPQGYSLGE